MAPSNSVTGLDNARSSVTIEQPLSDPVDTRKKVNKTSSLLGFLSLKDPSTAALAQAAKEYQKQVASSQPSPNRPPTAASTASAHQRLPPDVPKVNSKWDGLPPSASAARLRSKSQGTFRRDSTVSLDSKSSSTSSARHRHLKERPRTVPNSHSLQAIVTGLDPAPSARSSIATPTDDRQDSVTALSPIIPPDQTPFAAPGPISKKLNVTTIGLKSASVRSEAANSPQKQASAATKAPHSPSTDMPSPTPTTTTRSPAIAVRSSWRNSLRIIPTGASMIAKRTSSISKHITTPQVATPGSGTQAEPPTPSASVTPGSLSDTKTGTRPKPDPARLSAPFGIHSVDSRPVLDLPSGDSATAHELPKQNLWSEASVPGTDDLRDPETVQHSAPGHARSASQDQDRGARNFSKPFQRLVAATKPADATVASVPLSRFALNSPKSHQRNMSTESEGAGPTYTLSAASESNNGSTYASTPRDTIPRHDGLAEMKRNRRLTADSQTVVFQSTVDGPLDSLPAW